MKNNWSVTFDPDHKNELSYTETVELLYSLSKRNKKVSITTGYMDLMTILWDNYEWLDNIIVKNDKGFYRLPNHGENLETSSGHDKCMQKAHNIYKMWRAGSFNSCINSKVL